MIINLTGIIMNGDAITNELSIDRYMRPLNIYRGAQHDIVLTVFNASGDIPDLTSASVVFGVKDSFLLKQYPYVLKKTATRVANTKNIFTVAIGPSDTNSLLIKRYLYDVFADAELIIPITAFNVQASSR